jgi:hypothetical protein
MMLLRQAAFVEQLSLTWATLVLLLFVVTAFVVLLSLSCIRRAAIHRNCFR